VRRAIYGGGLLASVGNFTMEDATKPTVTIDKDDIQDWLFDETDKRNGIATITITGGIIGNLNADGTLINGGGRPGYNNGHVYGSGCGMVADALAHDQQYSQMGYVYRSRVNISQASADQPTIIRGSVFGSGENGHVWEDTHVNISGGTIGAERNTTTDTVQHRFLGNVYGSGRGVDHTAEGALTHISRSAGKVQGNTHIDISGGTIWNDVYGGGSMASIGDSDEQKGEVTSEHPFGYSTGTASVTVRGTTEVHGSVYGSGRGIASTNPDYQQAAFIKNSDVRILGSAHIYNNVYGGGNAASTPATQIDINGTYEIEEVFGGGNGKDDISLDGGTTTRPNPGANVGYTNYSVYDIGDGGTLVVRDSVDALTPEARAQHFQYGSGQARVNIHGGRIHRVYGGSNTKGNVRHAALTMLEETKKTDGEQEVPAEP
jgi:hypothetical protein